MGNLVLIILIVVLAITIIGYIINLHNSNSAKRSFHEMSQFAHNTFNISHSVNGFGDKYLFILDNENKRIIMHSATDIKTIPFRNIEGLELHIDEKIINKTSLQSTIGAVAGGYILDFPRQ